MIGRSAQQKFSFGQPTPKMPNAIAPQLLNSFNSSSSHHNLFDQPSGQQGLGGPMRGSLAMQSSTREDRMRVPHFAKPFRVQVDKLPATSNNNNKNDSDTTKNQTDGGRSGSLF